MVIIIMVFNMTNNDKQNYIGIKAFIHMHRLQSQTGQNSDLFASTVVKIEKAHAISIFITIFSGEGSGEPAQMRRLARAFVARIRKL